jgi:soluble lytic murein transglycosylase-like protein
MVIFLPNFRARGWNKVKYIAAFIIFVSVLFSTDPCTAGIYRYEDERGVVHFTNCPRDSKFKLYIKESKEDEEGAGALPLRYAKDSNRYDQLISEFSEKYQVDFALIKAMIRAESGFNPFAVSRKGAKGLMQLMPETAQRVNVFDIHNPRENIEGGVRYLKHLLSLFDNDLRLSLAAYNAGENLVYAIRTIPPYRETVDYVRKVLSYYQSYQGYSPPPLRQVTRQGL